jgi:hypothetical protein
MGRVSEETEITRRLVLRMKAESEAMGARFVAVILPTRRTLRLLMEEKEDIWAPLCDQLQAAEVEIWNLEAPFAAEGNTAEDDASRFLPDGHLTPGTNARVAAAVLEHLGFEKGVPAGADSTRGRLAPPGACANISGPAAARGEHEIVPTPPRSTDSTKD